MIALFHAQIDDHGKPRLHVGNERLFATLRPYAGKRVEIVVREPKKRGSGNQQRYYFGQLIKRIADEIGEFGSDGMDRIHDALMRKYWPVDVRGEIEIRRSYMDLDSKEREQYHEWIRTDAATGDLIGSPLWLPMPNEEGANA